MTGFKEKNLLLELQLGIEAGLQKLKEEGKIVTKRELGLSPGTVLAYQVKELEIIDDG